VTKVAVSLSVFRAPLLQLRQRWRSAGNNAAMYGSQVGKQAWQSTLPRRGFGQYRTLPDGSASTWVLASPVRPSFSELTAGAQRQNAGKSSVASGNRPTAWPVRQRWRANFQYACHKPFSCAARTGLLARQGFAWEFARS
jgi:hypothetical protein